MGVVLAPVTEDLYVAARGRGAWWQVQPDAEWERIYARNLAKPPVVRAAVRMAVARSDHASSLGEDYQPATAWAPR
jgi:3'(2'), 5'-bisphosphate nucleotidase